MFLGKELYYMHGHEKIWEVPSSGYFSINSLPISYSFQRQAKIALFEHLHLLGFLEKNKTEGTHTSHTH